MGGRGLRLDERLPELDPVALRVGAPAEPAEAVVLAARIDRDAVRNFRVQVPPALWPERVDLCDVELLTPAGVELLIHLARKPRRQGRELQVSGTPAALRPVLEKAGLAHLARPDTAAR